MLSWLWLWWQSAPAAIPMVMVCPIAPRLLLADIAISGIPPPSGCVLEVEWPPLLAVRIPLLTVMLVICLILPQEIVSTGKIGTGLNPVQVFTNLMKI